MHHPDLSLDHGLRSERFDLEPLAADGAELFAELCADTEIVKSLIGDWSTAARRLENARAWIDDDNYYVIWGIHDRQGRLGSGAAFIGVVGVEAPLPEAGKGPSIFYAIDQDYWGRGVGSEITAAVIEHLFEQPGVEAVEALVLPRLNPASVRLLEKQGMRLVGRYPMAKYVGDDCLPTLQYEIWRAQVALPADARHCIQEVAFKIGQFVGDGISSRDEMSAALMISAHENGLVDKVGINETRQLIDAALRDGMAEDGWLHYRLERAQRSRGG
jgi:RimJ/RimL family protein N-acetyltransferase